MTAARDNQRHPRVFSPRGSARLQAVSVRLLAVVCPGIAGDRGHAGTGSGGV